MTHSDPDMRPSAEELQLHNWVTDSSLNISPDEVYLEMISRRKHILG